MPTRVAAVLVAFFLMATACDDDQAAAPSPEGRSPATTPPAGESPGRRCSASDEDAELLAQPELPKPVADTRRDIAEAAAACDFERLASIAGGGATSFTHSLGQGTRPARLWRRQERGGDQPMRFLVGLLDRPFGTITAGGTVQYVWPSAFAFEAWTAVPQEDRAALKPLYDERDLDSFARFGGYIGYRVGISESGEWLYFVAGD